MTAMTPLEQAVAAWTRDPHADEMIRRQWQFDDARALGECGVFSNRNIALITGLAHTTVADLTGKATRTGGRLNPESLPMLLDAAQHWLRYHAVDVQSVQVAIDLGTSIGMVEKLAGIPHSTLQRRLR